MRYPIFPIFPIFPIKPAKASNATTTPHCSLFATRFERRQKPRADRREEAEAGNKVASVGQIDRKKIYLLLAICTRLIIAKQYAYAYTSQTSLPRRNKLNESLSDPQKKDHSKLSGK